jgi:S-adenosylmethionine synthetase
MAVREQDELEIVMNVPILSGAVLSEAGYRSLVDDLQRDLERTAQEFLSDSLRIHISLNTSTGNPFAAKRQYVLGIGSCVECGDEGVVGRGNDAMGLISLMRPRSMEAPFGKNPIYHGGKVYAYYAQEIARSVATHYACHASVMIVARHSDPLQDPWQVIIQVDHSQADRIAIATCARAVLERSDHVPALIDGYLVPSLERT